MVSFESMSGRFVIYNDFTAYSSLLPRTRLAAGHTKWENRTHSGELCGTFEAAPLEFECDEVRGVRNYFLHSSVDTINKEN